MQGVIANDQPVAYAAAYPEHELGRGLLKGISGNSHQIYSGHMPGPVLQRVSLFALVLPVGPPADVSRNEHVYFCSPATIRKAAEANTMKSSCQTRAVVAGCLSVEEQPLGLCCTGKAA